jgi:uncharacterized protein (DUF4415 family)
MSAKKRSIGSDLAKVDAHVNTPTEYEEISELTGDDLARGVPHIGRRAVTWEEFEASRTRKIGRPRSENPKEPVNLRLDADVLAYFRATGHGWQSRINAALRKAARLPTERGNKKRAS